MHANQYNAAMHDAAAPRMEPDHALDSSGDEMVVDRPVDPRSNRDAYLDMLRAQASGQRAASNLKALFAAQLEVRESNRPESVPILRPAVAASGQGTADGRFRVPLLPGFLNYQTDFVNAVVQNKGLGFRVAHATMPSAVERVYVWQAWGF